MQLGIPLAEHPRYIKAAVRTCPLNHTMLQIIQRLMS